MKIKSVVFDFHGSRRLEASVLRENLTEAEAPHGYNVDAAWKDVFAPMKLTT